MHVRAYNNVKVCVVRVGSVDINIYTLFAAQEWTIRTLISHERTSVQFLVLPGSLLPFTEIT